MISPCLLKPPSRPLFPNRYGFAYDLTMDILPRLRDHSGATIVGSDSNARVSRPEATSIMIRRSRGREIALQVLYQLEQNPAIDPVQVERFIQRRLSDESLRKFARELVAGVRDDQARIDALISEVAENWRLDRMAAIDRNILRLGAFELLSSEGVPPKVAINEALELAKRYSTAQSSRFVNGILDRLIAADTEAKTRPESDLEPASETTTPPTTTTAAKPKLKGSSPGEPTFSKGTREVLPLVRRGSDNS